MNIEKSFGLARRHKDFDEEIFKKIKDQELSTISTKEARQVYNWHRQVSNCFHKTISFVRLEVSKKEALYGKIDPEHFVEDLAARWFNKRFPLFTVILESKTGTYVISKEKGLEVFEGKTDTILNNVEGKSMILSDLEGFDAKSFWESYYESQFIRQRENKGYFKRNIPKKYLESDLDIENRLSAKSDLRKFIHTKH